MFSVTEQEITKKAIMVHGEDIKDSQYAKGMEVEKEHKDIYDLFKNYLKKNNLEMPISEEDFYGMVVAAHAKENAEDYYPEGPEPYKLVPVEKKEASRQLDDEMTKFISQFKVHGEDIDDFREEGDSPFKMYKDMWVGTIKQQLSRKPKLMDKLLVHYYGHNVDLEMNIDKKIDLITAGIVGDKVGD